MPIRDDGGYYGWDPKTQRAQCGGYPDERSREPLNKRIEAKYGRIQGEDLTKALGYLMDKHSDKHMYHAPELNCRMLPECRSCGSLRSVDIKPAKAQAQPSSRKTSSSAPTDHGVRHDGDMHKEAKSVKKRGSRGSLTSSTSSGSVRSASVSSIHSKSSKRSSISSIDEEHPRGIRKNSK